MSIDFRRFRQVLAIAEHRSFSRAAQALHLSQPSLTRSIQSLEEDLGARLFDRGRRGVELTSLGRLVLTHARRAEAVASDFSRDLALAKGAEIGKLQVGIGPWGGSAFVGPAIGDLVNRYPQLRVALTVVPPHEFQARLRQREVDAIVGDVTDLDAGGDFEIARFSEHRPRIVCRAGHPLTKLASPTLADVVGYNFAGPPLEPHVVARLRDLFAGELHPMWERPEGILPVSCAYSAILKPVLARSDTVALMPCFIVARELERGELAVIRGVDLHIGIRMGVAWLRDRTISPATRALIDALLAHDRELVEQELRLLGPGKRGGGKTGPARGKRPRVS